MTTPNTDLAEQMWDAITKVRDQYPRVFDDAPTDEVVDAVIPLVNAAVKRGQAEAWDEACEAFAWCIANGPVEDALPYVAQHNPHKEETPDEQ